MLRKKKILASLAIILGIASINAGEEYKGASKDYTARRPTRPEPEDLSYLKESHPISCEPKGNLSKGACERYYDQRIKELESLLTSHTSTSSRTESSLQKESIQRDIMTNEGLKQTICKGCPAR